MEKVHSDHLIKHPSFTPLEFEGKFVGDCLDHFETMLSKLGKVKILGYYSGSPVRVVLDTRKLDIIPFDYIYTYADRMHKDVITAVWADEKRLRIEADRLRNEREQKLSTPGNRVYVHPSYGRGGFTGSNGTVLSRDYGHATVKLDYNLTVTVEFSQLSEPRKNQKILTLKGELNCLYACLEATYQKPFGPDTRGAQRVSIQARIDAKIKELEDLEKEELTKTPQSVG